MSDLYEFNVWSNQPDTLTLTAYEQKRDVNDDGYISVNTSKYHSIEFTFPSDLSEIEHLLGDLAINQLPFTDYDDWFEQWEILTNETPERITEFLNNLPEYEMEQN